MHKITYAMQVPTLMIYFAVHLLSLNVAIEAFDAHGLRGQNERMLDVSDIVAILSSLYETISVGFFKMIIKASLMFLPDLLALVKLGI